MKARISGNARCAANIIRSGLAMVIPVLFIGSITVLLNSFPIRGYQDFLDTFLGGALRSILLMIQQGTLGILAVYITAALNFSFMKQTKGEQRLALVFGSLLGSLAGFFILAGFFSGEPDLSLLSGQGVFSAMIAGLLGPALFRKFESCFVRKRMAFVDGADSEFNFGLHVILPFLCVTLCFAAANYVVTVIFQVESLQHLFMKLMDGIFLRMHRSYSSGLLFTVLASVMWWFGIHGNNVLNQVAEDLFTEIIPGEIVSKSFMDTFVNMGGTGCVIGLLLAIAIFRKRSSTKKLLGMAVVPGIFNIGEMLVFGFPVIYNPLMIVPFVLAPILSYSNAYFLTWIGFAPQVSNEVVWTTPALMSGFLATGSMRGVIVQVLNILISLGCYAPFVILSEKKALEIFPTEMKELDQLFRENEKTAEKVVYTECEGELGRFAKHLAVELEVSMAASFSDGALDRAKNPMQMEYRSIYDNTGRCVGAEALLRWEHKQYGSVYPPLMIRIAEESGDLFELETHMIENAIRESERFRERCGEDFRMSINVTVKTLFDRRFLPFLQEMADRYRLRAGNICLEISEEGEPEAAEETGELLERIRVYGYIIRQ